MSQTTRLLVIVALFWFAQYIYVPFTTPFLLSQKVSADLVGIVIGVYGGMQLALRFPLGIGADLIGRHKPWIVIGCLSSGIASIVRCFFPTGEGFLIANCLSGVASSMWMSFMLLYTQGLSPDKLQRGMGYVLAANNGGIGAAFVCSAVLYSHFGMLLLCILASISGLLAAALSLGLHETSPLSAPKNQRATLSDTSSTSVTNSAGKQVALNANAPTTATATTTTTTAATSAAAITTTDSDHNANQQANPCSSVQVHTACSLKCSPNSSLNETNESKAAHRPQLSFLLGVLKNPVLWFFAGICTIQQGLLMGTVMSFSNEAAHQIGGSDWQIGLMTVIYIASCVLSCYLSATAWSIRLGPAIPMVLTQVLMAVYCFGMPLIDNIYGLMLLQILMGSSGGFVFAWANTEALQGVEKTRRASALGLFQSIFAFGMTIVPIFVGWLIEKAQGDLQVAFDAQALLALFGALATAWFYAYRRYQRRKVALNH